MLQACQNRCNMSSMKAEGKNETNTESCCSPRCTLGTCQNPRQAKSTSLDKGPLCFGLRVTLNIHPRAAFVGPRCQQSCAGRLQPSSVLWGYSITWLRWAVLRVLRVGSKGSQNKNRKPFMLVPQTLHFDRFQHPPTAYWTVPRGFRTSEKAVGGCWLGFWTVA